MENTADLYTTLNLYTRGSLARHPQSGQPTRLSSRHRLAGELKWALGTSPSHYPDSKELKLLIVPDPSRRRKRSTCPEILCGSQRLRTRSLLVRAPLKFPVDVIMNDNKAVFPVFHSPSRALKSTPNPSSLALSECKKPNKENLSKSLSPSSLSSSRIGNSRHNNLRSSLKEKYKLIPGLKGSLSTLNNIESSGAGSKSFLSLAQQKASRTVTKYKAFPSIWIRARNMGLFPSLVLAALIAKMAKQHKTQITTKKPRNLEQLQIDFNIPWGFFHSACQGVPALCQIGAVLYLNQSHVYWMRYAMGRGTNTKAELSVLCTLLHLASSVGIEKIQIMGYSIAAVDWANAKSSLENMRLDNVKKEGQRLINLLDWKIIIHIFRELNQKAYELSIAPVSIVQTEVMDGQEIGSMSCRFG